MAFSNPSTVRTLDLFCFSHLRWNFVTQRPQHLLRQAVRHARVFYWEEPIHFEGAIAEGKIEGGAYLATVEDVSGVWILTPHLPTGSDWVEGQEKLLDEFLKQEVITNYVSWYYTPMAYVFSKHLLPEVLVYDCMDQLSNFKDAPKELVAREQELLKRADVVFTGGLSLYEEKRGQHANVHLFPSSVDVAHFATAKQAHRSEPQDQAGIAEPRIGFYGVIDERFDLELLGSMAALRPEFQFVILGPMAKIDPATLPQAKNIHYLGGKSYGSLPGYLAGWRVAMLPFAMNESTRFISPTKTPEYLAAGRQVVSTPILDVVREYGSRGLVQIADKATAFAVALDKAMETPSEQWGRAVETKLAESSWASTWTAMQKLVEGARTKGAVTSPAMQAGSATIYPKTQVLLTTSVLASETALTTVPAMERGYRRERTEHFDYLIAGAGFAGSVLAERLASQMGKKVLIIDKRSHIAGNAYDTYNAEGILIHQYGPHIFHTNSDEVVAYLSNFTSWRNYEHRVLSSVDGQLLPVPINLDTINRLYDLNLNEEGMKTFLAGRTVQRAVIKTSEDIVISRVGQELYEKFFRNYTRKQWGLDPSQLDAAVAGRIPVRFDHDDRYFTDTFQAMPLHGYTRMFERMLDHSSITTRLGVDFAEIAALYPEAKVVYTGPIDEYFGFKFGPLPYRSLEFAHKTLDQEIFQAAPVVNYPNDHEFTRVTEFKYLTGQRHAKTSVVYEYPRATGDPYYPIPRPENAALFARYRELADRVPDVTFCGRLANYRYFNMDQVVAQALKTFRRIEAEARSKVLAIPAMSKISVEQGRA